MKTMRNNGILRKTLKARRSWFWFSGGILVLAVIGAFFFIPLSPKEKNKRYSGPPKTKEEAIELIQRDTDNDGLKDWEENIYGTDPEKDDTDGDGASDGDEIKSSRNPLVAGPGDELSIPLPKPADGNKTEALANEFINRSLTQVLAEAMTEGELPKDLSDMTAVNSYVAKLGEERLLDKVIPPSLKEFTISGDNSNAAVKEYLNAVFKIHVDNFSKIDSDISILYLASHGAGAKAFRRLDGNISAIEKAMEETKKVPVPSDWTEFAKNYVWYLSKTLAAVKIFKDSEKDPVSSLLILNDRINLITDFGVLYAEAKNKLASRGLTFEDNEPAAFLAKLR